MRNEKKRVKTKTVRTKQEKLQLAAYVFTAVSFIVPIIYLIFKMIFGTVGENEAGYHSNADYTLMIIQCVLGLLVLNVPSLLGKKFKFEVPPFLYVYYVFFLYCSIFLGEVTSFYYKFKWWDSFLHCTSSLMVGFFGFMVITILNRNDKILLNLSPFFVCLFAFCFAVMIGALWEIYEFTFDGLLGLNMQKHTNANGVEFAGHAALADTMKDIITDAAGALIASIIGYVGLKKNPKWLIPKITEVEPKKEAEKLPLENADELTHSSTEEAAATLDAAENASQKTLE